MKDKDDRITRKMIRFLRQNRIRYLSVSFLLCLAISICASNSNSQKLLPIDPEIGTAGDVALKALRQRDSASVEISHPDWKPWRFSLTRLSHSYRVNLVGFPVNYQLIKYDDSTVILSLVKHKVAQEPIAWPEWSFRLYLGLGNEYAIYRVESDSTGNLAITAIKEAYFVNLVKRLPENTVALLLPTELNKLPSPTRHFLDSLEETGGTVVLEPGYYETIPYEVKKGKSRRKRQAYNYTDAGQLMVIRLSGSPESLREALTKVKGGIELVTGN